jgi:hypothetical protein
MNSPFDFVASAAQLWGCEVERQGPRIDVIASERALGIGLQPDFVSYTEEPDVADLEDDCEWIGLGSAALERWTQVVMSSFPWAAAEVVDLPAMRDLGARKVAEHWAPRNAVTELKSISPTPFDVLTVYACATLQADDHRDILIDATVALDPLILLPRYSQVIAQQALREIRNARPHVWPDSVTQRILDHLGGQAQEAGRSFFESATRRLDRDLSRMAQYYQRLRDEVGSRRLKGKLTLEEATEKKQAIASEEANKTSELRHRFSPRTLVSPMAAQVTRIPGFRVEFLARRRKQSRILELRYDALTHKLLPLACDACGQATIEPALCDDHLHALCVGCVPRAEGRFSCPSCAKHQG